jgi:hypothetical protein
VCDREVICSAAHHCWVHSRCAACTHSAICALVRRTRACEQRARVGHPVKHCFEVERCVFSATRSRCKHVITHPVAAARWVQGLRVTTHCAAAVLVVKIHNTVGRQLNESGGGWVSAAGKVITIHYITLHYVTYRVNHMLHSTRSRNLNGSHQEAHRAKFK